MCPAAEPTASPPIRIRAITADDVPALHELFEALDLDDRFHRFLSAYHPSTNFLSAMASVSERGGARYVAELVGDPPGRSEIVGEAGYSLLPTGEGELTVTVARSWRERLAGPLVDVVREHAAGAGVANLETDVAHTDHALRALLRTRGAVVAGHRGWVDARLRVGTLGATPTWPAGHHRRRLLVEGAGGRWAGADEARAAGLDVLVCVGPLDGHCPALAGEQCTLAATADTIVVSHPPDEPRWRALLTAHADVHPDVPVVLEPGLPAGAHPWGVDPIGAWAAVDENAPS